VLVFFNNLKRDDLRLEVRVSFFLITWYFRPLPHHNYFHTLILLIQSYHNSLFTSTPPIPLLQLSSATTSFLWRHSTFVTEIPLSRMAVALEAILAALFCTRSRLLLRMRNSRLLQRHFRDVTQSPALVTEITLSRMTCAGSHLGPWIMHSTRILNVKSLVETSRSTCDIRDVITNHLYICLAYVKCCGDNVPVIVMNYIWRSVYGLITDYIPLLTWIA
jgi:hypothetical protein